LSSPHYASRASAAKTAAMERRPAPRRIKVFLTYLPWCK
jgi:hypothetical protein